MSVAEFMKRMRELGAPAEAIEFAVERMAANEFELAEARAERRILAERRQNEAERKRKSRTANAAGDVLPNPLSRDITGQGPSRDITGQGPSRDVTGQPMSRDVTSGHGTSQDVTTEGNDADRTIFSSESLVPPSAPKGASSPKGSGRSDRGAFLAADWQPSEVDWRFALAELGSDEAARREREKFRNFWFAKSGADGRKRDWSATWRNWVMRAADDGTGNRKGQNRQPAGAQPHRSVVNSVAAGVATAFARRGLPLGGRQDNPGRERDEDRRGADPAVVEDADWIDAGGGNTARYRA